MASWNFCELLVSDGRVSKFVSLNNEPFQVRLMVINVSCDEPLYLGKHNYLSTVSVNKCGGSFNVIDDPYAQICVQNKVKNMNEKVFNLLSKVNKTNLYFSRNHVSVNVYWMKMYVS